MILIIRGHIRDSFETNNLYNLVKEIYNIFNDLQIFIHTWNIFANNISWREINVNNRNVNDEIIYDYFGDLKHLIKHIIIDDDTKIQLIGNLSGKINSGLMPIVGWKNYWYGKYRIIDYIYNTYRIDENEMIVNFRFDILNNSNSLNETNIIDLIKYYNGSKFTKNIFYYKVGVCGIDNVYVGNIKTMHKLTQTFFYELDDILIKNNDIVNQEILVFKINNILFD